MKTLRVAVLILLATTVAAPMVSAQAVRGFVTGGVISDVNHQRFPSAAGGVLVDVGQPWLSVGAQGETFWQWPYFAGRGTLFGQGNLIPSGPIRPFVLGGVAFGETAGRMFGGGVELRPPNRRLGLRVSVEDYLARISEGNPRDAQRYAEHQLTLRVGPLF